MGDADIIQKAIEAEQYNLQFYRELTQKAIAKYAGEALERLASEEQKHVEILTSYRTSLQKQGDVNLPGAGDFSSIWDNYNAAIDETRQVLQPHTDELTVIQKGIDLEKKGIELYRQAVENASDEVGRKVFGFLHSQEVIHRKYLEKLLERLKALYEEPPESRPKL